MERKKYLLLLCLLLPYHVFADNNILTNVYKIDNIEETEIQTDTKPTINSVSDCTEENYQNYNTRVMQGIHFFKYNNRVYAIYSGYSNLTCQYKIPTNLTLVDVSTGTVVATNNEKKLAHGNDITCTNLNNGTINCYVTAHSLIYNTQNNDYYFLEEIPDRLDSNNKQLYKACSIISNTCYNEERINTLQENESRYTWNFDINFNESNPQIEYKNMILNSQISGGFDRVVDNKFIIYSANRFYSADLNDNKLLYNKEINSIINSYKEVIFASNQLNLDEVLEPYIFANDNEFGSQGIDYANNNIYFARSLSSGSNYVFVYNPITGIYKYALYIPNTIVKGEIESITVIDNDLYLGYNKSSDNIEKVSFIKIDNIDIYENKYQENHQISINQYVKDDNKMIISRINNNNKTSFINDVTTNGKYKNIIGTTEDMIATGNKLRISFRENIEDLSDIIEYKLSILGDVDGNGTSDIEDAKKIAKHIIDKNVLIDEEYLQAANYNDDNNIKMNDAMRILKNS